MSTLSKIQPEYVGIELCSLGLALKCFSEVRKHYDKWSNYVKF